MTDDMTNRLLDIINEEIDDYFAKMDLANMAEDPWLSEVLCRSAKDEESHARYLMEYLMDGHAHLIPENMRMHYEEMERHLW